MSSQALEPGTKEVLSFDCYGTLIDWDGGIESALARIPSLVGADLSRLVADREQVELELIAGPFRLYRDVLVESLRRASALQGREPAAEECAAFADSMAAWPPFADSSEALARLATRYRLAIVSNVETATLTASVAALGAPFDPLVTAEEVRSYKPAAVHFEELLARCGTSREAVLHVAGSLVHDIGPARRLGWDAVWIDRRGEGVLAARPHGLEADRVFPDLASLADRLVPPPTR